MTRGADNPIRRAVSRLRDRQGQTFILVMTVTAMATVMGLIAMSGALMSLRLVGMKRISEKNFYHLELAAEEIRLGMARDAAQVFARSQSPEEFLKGYMGDSVGVHDLAVLAKENEISMGSRRAAAIESAASYLGTFSLTMPVKGQSRTATDRTEELSISVGDLQVNEATGEICFKDTHITLINYERDAQSEIVCDLRIPPLSKIPDLDGVVTVENWQRIG